MDTPKNESENGYIYSQETLPKGHAKLLISSPRINECDKIKTPISATAKFSMNKFEVDLFILELQQTDKMTRKFPKSPKTTRIHCTTYNKTSTEYGNRNG